MNVETREAKDVPHKTSKQFAVRFAAAMMLLWFAHPAAATDRVYQIVTNANARLHWPAPDGLIATTDDVISADLSPKNFSAPNSAGSYSYNAFDFGNGPEDALLPSPMNAVTFVQGTVTVDTAVAQNGGGPLIKNWLLSGSEPFPGHGPYTAQITKANSGSYDPVTKAFSENLNFLANLAAGTAPATNFTLTGAVYVVDAGSFGAGTGNQYVDLILIPLAQGLGANGLLFARVSGIVPPSSGGTGGSFPQLPIAAVVFAVDLSTPAPPLAITNVSIVPTGLRIAWNAQPGRTYSVEAADSLSTPFAVLATNLAGPSFVHLSATLRSPRFYRVRSP